MICNSDPMLNELRLANAISGSVEKTLSGRQSNIRAYGIIIVSYRQQAHKGQHADSNAEVQHRRLGSETLTPESQSHICEINSVFFPRISWLSLLGTTRSRFCFLRCRLGSSCL